MTKLTLRFLKFCTLIFITFSIASCSTNSSVVDNGIIQKRKYRKGVHLNILKKQQVKECTIPEEVVAQNDKRTERDNEPVRTAAKSKKIIQPILDQIEAPTTNPVGFVKRVIKQKIPSKKDEEHSIASTEGPDEITETRTITKKYQKGGKIALLLAWIYALMPVLIWAVGLMGFPVFQLVVSFLAFVVFLLALIFALRNKKYSSHARKALWVIFLSIVFWAVVYSVLTFVLAMTLI